MGLSISDSIKRVPGIYALWNESKGKLYIGSSQNVKQRIINHRSKLRNNSHINSDMQVDYNDGDTFYAFCVLELPGIENLRFYENYAIKKFESDKTGYNKENIASSHTKEMNKICKVASSIDYYANGADPEEKQKIIEEVMENGK